MNGWSREDLGGSETVLYDNVMNTCHYTFIKSHRMYTTKNETQCKLITFGDNDVLTEIHLKNKKERI